MTTLQIPVGTNQPTRQPKNPPLNNTSNQSNLPTQQVPHTHSPTPTPPPILLPFPKPIRTPPLPAIRIEHQKRRGSLLIELQFTPRRTVLSRRSGARLLAIGGRARRRTTQQMLRRALRDVAQVLRVVLVRGSSRIERLQSGTA